MLNQSLTYSLRMKNMNTAGQINFKSENKNISTTTITPGSLIFPDINSIVSPPPTNAIYTPLVATPSPKKGGTAHHGN